MELKENGCKSKSKLPLKNSPGNKLKLFLYKQMRYFRINLIAYLCNIEIFIKNSIYVPSRIS